MCQDDKTPKKQLIKVGDKYINFDCIAYVARGLFGGSGLTIGFNGGAGDANQGILQLRKEEAEIFEKWLNQNGYVRNIEDEINDNQ